MLASPARHGHPPTGEMTAANNVYTILPSQTGDGSLAVNKAAYTPYPEASCTKLLNRSPRISRMSLISHISQHTLPA